MLVAGPNARKDFITMRLKSCFINSEGDNITVVTIQDGRRKEIQVKEESDYLYLPIFHTAQ